MDCSSQTAVAGDWTVKLEDGPKKFELTFYLDAGTSGDDFEAKLVVRVAVGC